MSKTLARASSVGSPSPSLCPVSTGNALLNLLITAGPDKASAGDGKGGEKEGQCAAKSKWMNTINTKDYVKENKKPVERRCYLGS